MFVVGPPLEKVFNLRSELSWQVFVKFVGRLIRREPLAFLTGGMRIVTSFDSLRDGLSHSLPDEKSLWNDGAMMGEY
jgi:hypothetical protein